MVCDHLSCGSTEKGWLPYTYRGRDRGLKPHTYCVKCGLVRNPSTERPRSVGYYINLISALSSLYKVTQVQIRLIVHEMERLGLDDSYGIDRHQQEKLFLDILRRHLNVPEEALNKIMG
jgi:hypothetical protein